MHGVVPHTWMCAFLPTGDELKHRVERGDLVDADVGHPEHICAAAQHGLGDQPLLLLARQSSGITAEACLPGGYLAIVAFAQAPDFQA